MKTTDPQFKPGISDKSWFKKGHKLSPESIEKMKKSKRIYTPEELKERERIRNNQPDRIKWRFDYNRSPKRKYDVYKRSALFKHIVFLLTYNDFLTFWKKPCNYCGNIVETIGLDRVDNSKGYLIENIVSCCKLCNYMKREITKDEFLKQCLKIAKLNFDNKKS